MNLVEGERIEQIERTEDGWWSGVGPGGKSGLFPRKYGGSALCYRILMFYSSFEADHVELEEPEGLALYEYASTILISRSQYHLSLVMKLQKITRYPSVKVTRSFRSTLY